MLPALRVPGQGLDGVGADLGQYTMRHCPRITRANDRAHLVLERLRQFRQKPFDHALRRGVKRRCEPLEVLFGHAGGKGGWGAVSLAQSADSLGILVRRQVQVAPGVSEILCVRRFDELAVG
jgi:hypothetical protein